MMDASPNIRNADIGPQKGLPRVGGAYPQSAVLKRLF
jgi:hypothetical protein